ncbi:hypothetical protein D3C81_1795490 [compost metagenome]
MLITGAARASGFPGVRSNFTRKELPFLPFTLTENLIVGLNCVTVISGSAESTPEALLLISSSMLPVLACVGSATVTSASVSASFSSTEALLLLVMPPTVLLAVFQKFTAVRFR